MPPPTIRFITPIRIDKLTRVVQIGGVDTYVHWSVFAISALMLANVASRPGLTLVGLLSYLSVILIHEVGHLVAAQRLGCRVESIKLYAVFGTTSFETPWTRLDHCVIAWSGVLAQAVVAIPLVAWVSVFGFTHVAVVNAIFAILGYINLGIAVFNLLPFPPLDGAIAWGLLAALLARNRAL